MNYLIPSSENIKLNFSARHKTCSEPVVPDIFLKKYRKTEKTTTKFSELLIRLLPGKTA